MELGSESETPWEIHQSIQFQGALPKLALIQEGWKEMEHANIIESKNKISNLESHEEWELRKKITNPYEAIFSGSSDTNFPSLAKVHPLSRSYFKMIEMLHVIDFWRLVSKGVPFRSAHVCEGPGGFLQCIVEKLKEKHIPIGAIHAMTLRPTKSHIPGWRRSIQFLRKYPQIQLEYGADDTGNILLFENQAAFCARSAESNIFTADGGFDFSVDYSNQEQMAFPLLLASFTMGLASLAKGGTMIIKLFDIYARATQDLFLGSATFFESFTLYKPATSRPCNSERYFIGRGFIGMSDELEKWIDTLREAQVKHLVSPITQLVETWPSEVTDAVKEQILFQEEIQIQCIEDTLNLDTTTIAQRLLTNIQLSKDWCKTFGVKH